MNVLLISPLPPPAGGIASWTKKYLESRKAQEHNIFVVNTAVIGGRVNEFNKRSIGNEVLRLWKITADLKKQLTENKIDVVHLNCAIGRFGSIIKDFLFAVIVKRDNVKLIAHFHCDVLDTTTFKTNLFFFRRITRLADAVLTLSERSNNFAIECCNKKSVSLPNFVSDEYYESITTEKEISDRINTILYVGHIQEAKGCDVIYETAERFPEIQFILLGYISDPFKKRFKPKNLELRGEVSNEAVKAEMLKADLLLFPTRTEGFPYAVIEAMACGLPVIATPVGAIPEIVETSGGLLVPVNDTEAVTMAISKLQERELRERISRWNRKKVKDYYTADKTLNRLFDIYAGVSGL